MCVCKYYCIYFLNSHSLKLHLTTGRHFTSDFSEYNSVYTNKLLFVNILIFEFIFTNSLDDVIYCTFVYKFRPMQIIIYAIQLSLFSNLELHIYMLLQINC